MSYDKEGAYANGSTIRKGGQDFLYNGDQLAEAGSSTGGKQERRSKGRVLGDSRIGPANGAPKSRATEEAQRGQRKDEIDPLALSYVMMSEMDYLPTCSGVYFVINDSGSVVYIGQSINIRQRWRAHHIQSSLCDLNDLQSARRVRLAWLEVDKAELDQIEIELIRHFKPRFNRTHISEELKPNGQGKNRELSNKMKVFWRGKCEECGNAKYLCVTHITPPSYGGTGDLDNLILLCRSCCIRHYGKFRRESLGANRI